MHHTRVLFCLALTISIIAVFANTYGDPLNEGSEFPAITSRRKRSSEELLDESLMVQLLSHMEKAPQMLSQERMNSLRDGIPSKVEEFLEFINNERLLKAVSEGLVKDRDYNELLFSLILLNTINCRPPEGIQALVCVAIQDPLRLPYRGVYRLHLSAFLPEWVDTNDIYLTTFPYNEAFEETAWNSYHHGARNYNHLASRGNKREVTIDITERFVDLLDRNGSLSYPVVLAIAYRGSLHASAVYHYLSQSDLLGQRREAKAALIVHTPTTNQLRVRFGHQPRRLSERSWEDGQWGTYDPRCPSFLHAHRNQTRCCLFKYKLTSKQMDHNEQLRFIISPRTLQLNVCHGRCIGTFMPADHETHYLLNRYYKGLEEADRQLLRHSMPCCAGKTTAPLALLVEQDSKPVLMKLENGVKTSCACA